MYKIFADDTLIYDSTVEDFKIGKGSITLEVNKSGSFSFSLYPDHFYYDNFVKLKTVITVYKSGKIVFRGRILNDVTDYRNIKSITCEGELGFLQDSIIRPFAFSGSPRNLLTKLITEHNAQVDDFKRFKIGVIEVEDNNDYIERSNEKYESTLTNISGRLLESALGGYIYITHGEDGTETIPTINYVTVINKISSQTIEFGLNLKDYTKTAKAEDIATAIIPFGAEVEIETESGDETESGSETTEKVRLTIADVNNGSDYVYSETGVAMYGWIFKTVEWNDVTDANNLKKKAEAYLDTVINQNITIELTAIDLHLLDPTIESINVCEFVKAVSTPHNFDATLLCNKQTIDILKPDNDSYVLGYTKSSFTESNSRIKSRVEKLDAEYVTTEKFATTIKETKVLIETTKESITSSVSKQYVTESKFSTEVGVLDSRITQTAESIKSEVSATYATKDTLKGYTTSSQVSSMIKQSADEINLSVSGTYATKDSLKDYATTESVTSAISVAVGKIDLSVYSTKTDLSGAVKDLESKISVKQDKIDLTVYATKTDVNGQISSINSALSLKANSADLGVYAKTTDLNGAVSNLESKLSLKADSASLGVYAKTSDVNTTLGNYATNSSVDDKLKNYPTTTTMNSALSLKANSADLGVYAKTSEVNSTLSGYVTTSAMNSALSLKADSASLGVYAKTTDVNTTLGNYAKTSDVNSKLNNYATNSSVDSKLSNYMTASEVRNAITVGVNGIDLSVYAKTSDLDAYETTAHLKNNYYTKNQTNSTILSTIEGKLALTIETASDGTKYSKLYGSSNKVVFDSGLQFMPKIDGSGFGFLTLDHTGVTLIGKISSDVTKVGLINLGNSAITTNYPTASLWLQATSGTVGVLQGEWHISNSALATKRVGSDDLVFLYRRQLYIDSSGYVRVTSLKL